MRVNEREINKKKRPQKESVRFVLYYCLLFECFAMKGATIKDNLNNKRYQNNQIRNNVKQWKNINYLNN